MLPPERAFCPLWPLPLVFPCPELSPQPRRLGGLSDRFRNFVRLAEPVAHFSIVVAGHDQRAETKAPPALYDLRAAVDENHLLGGVAFCRGSFIRSARV